MTTYIVQFTRTSIYEVEVEADSAEAARDLAQERGVRSSDFVGYENDLDIVLIEEDRAERTDRGDL